ncbi:MAG: pseudouridine-5'-phosphate glycosidase [Rhodothermia bacterium]
MPSVAFESTVFAHGLPSPLGLETALLLEEIAREKGADPRTIGIVSGRPIAGLSRDEIEHLATSDSVRKASLRDLPVVTALGLDAATTVAGTVVIARQNGIEVVCTGGIGGVHRGPLPDISNDLTVLARNPITLVCSGAKAILDLPATREHLESTGVTVVGYRTDEFPGFYSRSTGLPVDVRCENPDEVVEIVKARRRLGLTSATLVCVPVPEESAIPADQLESIIADAIDAAERSGVAGARLTPYLLAAIVDATGGESLKANIALLKNNAGVAAQIAVAIG